MRKMLRERITDTGEVPEWRRRVHQFYGMPRPVPIDAERQHADYLKAQTAFLEAVNRARGRVMMPVTGPPPPTKAPERQRSERLFLDAQSKLPAGAPKRQARKVSKAKREAEKAGGLRRR